MDNTVETRGSRQNFTPEQVVKSIAAISENESPQFNDLVATAYAQAYMFYRQCRGLFADISSDSSRTQAVARDILRVGESIAQTMVSGDEQKAIELNSDIKLRQEELADVKPYARMGGGDLGLHLLGLVDMLVDRDYEKMYAYHCRAALQKIEGVDPIEATISARKDPEVPNFLHPVRDFVHSDDLKRIHLLGPTASGWSELICSMVPNLREPEAIQQSLNLRPGVNIVHSPITFLPGDFYGNKDITEPVIVEDRIQSGDLLIIVDDSFGRTRLRQLDLWLQNRGLDKKVEVLGH